MPDDVSVRATEARVNSIDRVGLIGLGTEFVPKPRERSVHNESHAGAQTLELKALRRTKPASRSANGTPQILHEFPTEGGAAADCRRPRTAAHTSRATPSRSTGTPGPSSANVNPAVHSLCKITKGA